MYRSAENNRNFCQQRKRSMKTQRRGLTASDLKLIAAAAMLTDHIGCLFFPDLIWLRYIGRLAFPIFVFLLVEGALHTRNIKKYLARLAAFAVVSEIPYDLAFGSRLLRFEAQNIFVTLFIALFCLAVMIHLQTEYGIRGFYMGTAVFAAGGLLALLVRAEYGLCGIAVVYIMYIFRLNNVKKLLLTLLIFGLMPGYQWFGAAALLITWGYNGEKGAKAAWIKWAFYIFYPAHLLILYSIGIFLR